MRVLFVDDDPMMRRLGVHSLESIGGLSVTAAASGQEALAIVDELQPDVILLDYMMPEMDGDEVLAMLQRSSTTRHIPVVFLTGLEQGQQRDTLLTSGAVGWIPKPFDPGSLCTDLMAILGSPTATSVVQP